MDPAHVMVMGYSAGALLALHLGTASPKPAGVVAFYPPTWLGESWHRVPLKLFADLPDVPESFTQGIFEGRQVFSSPPMFNVQGKPVLDEARSAWFVMQLKRGTGITGLFGQGVLPSKEELESVDPVEVFSGEFPATCFVHGRGDVFYPVEGSERAVGRLREMGVRTRFVTGEFGHAFDLRLGEGESGWEVVEEVMGWVGEIVR